MENKKQNKTDAYPRYLYNTLVELVLLVTQERKCVMTYLPLYIHNIHQNAQFNTKYDGKEHNHENLFIINKLGKLKTKNS